MALTLTKLSETSSKITLGWTPVAGAIGYRYQSATQAPKWSHTWDATRDRVTFSKAAWYKVEALGVEDAGEYPPAAPPPTGTPLPSSGVITQGGTYTGTYAGTLQIRTSESVELDGCDLSNTGAAALLDVHQTGARVIVRRCRFTGALGSVGKAIHGSHVQSLVIENCEIEYTWGIRIDAVRSGGELRVLRTIARNLQRNRSDYSHFFQTANNGSTPFTCEAAWNEVVNEFGKSGCEDLISIHSTHGAVVSIHDNYLEGSWPDAVGDGHSGSCIMIEDSSGVLVYENVCVAGTNCGIGIASGGRNTVRSNRCVSSGRTPDGVELRAANVGIYANESLGGNAVHDNYIGWMGHPAGSFGRNDAWLPLGGGQWYSQNAYFPPGAISRQMEIDERWRWRSRIAAVGVKIGRA